MGVLSFKNLQKVYDGNVKAVSDFNLEVADKEFIVLVGPSGCGKSTTLRMVAGLEDISEGDLIIDGRRVNNVPPKDRNIAMVFQSYALYPHMSVYDNMAFGLKLRKRPKDEIKERVNEAAQILGLQDLLDRKPKALSGGQRQRVALGRAIVRDAEVFLMDEPLSNLDAKLRVQMRAEIIRLHERIKTTTVYVTHDQVEAMTMADRIVIMNDGYIQQVGSPSEVYDYPNNLFVGGFIGTPAMNFVNGHIDDKGYFVTGHTKISIPKAKYDNLKEQGYIGKDIVFGIRPEDIHDDNIVKETYPDAIVDFKVDVAELLGSETNITAQFENQKVIARVDARTDIAIDDTIQLGFDMNKSHFFDLETTQRIREKDEELKKKETRKKR